MIHVAISNISWQLEIFFIYFENFMNKERIFIIIAKFLFDVTVVNSKEAHLIVYLWKTSFYKEDEEGLNI